MIVILGPGSCGTTLLIKIFIALGVDSGNALEIFREKKGEIRRLGINYPWPKIIKGTGMLCKKLKEKSDLYNWDIEYIFICYRQLDPMVRSRIGKKRIPKSARGKDLNNFFSQQIPHTLGQALHQAAFFDCPVTIIKFPRMATDIDYLQYSLRDFNFSKEQLSNALESVLDSSKIRFGG
jgi:hypothetical protein